MLNLQTMLLRCEYSCLSLTRGLDRLLVPPADRSHWQFLLELDDDHFSFRLPLDDVRPHGSMSVGVSLLNESFWKEKEYFVLLVSLEVFPGVDERCDRVSVLLREGNHSEFQRKFANLEREIG